MDIHRYPWMDIHGQRTMDIHKWNSMDAYQKNVIKKTSLVIPGPAILSRPRIQAGYPAPDQAGHANRDRAGHADRADRTDRNHICISIYLASTELHKVWARFFFDFFFMFFFRAAFFPYPLFHLFLSIPCESGKEGVLNECFSH